MVFGFDQTNIILRGNLDNSLFMFEKKKIGRVAFMGGSITEMNGYRPLIMDWLEKRFPKTQFSFNNAGISSTCSTTGAFRLNRDVLSNGPLDLFFIEFAVNDNQDANHNHAACIRGMEGIIRQMRTKSPKTEIISTFFVNPGMLKKLQARETPLTMRAHQEVLIKYGVSQINLAREVADQIQKKSLTWSQFGGTHPKKFGNQMCAEMHFNLLEQAWKDRNPRSRINKSIPTEPINPFSYFNGHFLSPEKIQTKNWIYSEPDWSNLPGKKRSRYLDIPMLHSKSVNESLKVNFTGNAIGAFIVAGPDACVIEYNIDDQPNRSIDLFHRFSSNLHYPRTVIFAHDLNTGTHSLNLKIKPNSKSKAVRIMEFCIN